MGELHAGALARIGTIAISANRNRRLKDLFSATVVAPPPTLAQVRPNIDALAKEPANPGAANTTMNFRLEYRRYSGDLQDAEKNIIAPDRFVSDWKYTFQISPVVRNPFQPNPPTPPMEPATRAALLSSIR